MKIIEHYTERGFNVVITANFETGGLNIAQSMAGYVPVDCVWLNFNVYDPSEKKLHTFEREELYAAFERTKKERISLFKKAKTKLTISEDYEGKLIEIKQTITRRINNSLKWTDLNNRDKTITDGLPDSLKVL